MKVKTGREEVVYLLSKVAVKYELASGQEIKLNTNRKNYEDLARLLSGISNELPYTSKILGHDDYPVDNHKDDTAYPHRKYDITGGQVKDAYNGIVTNPRPYLVDACYIYLYGVGRNGFAKNPTDNNLIESNSNGLNIRGALSAEVSPVEKSHKKEQRYWLSGIVTLLIVLILVIFNWYAANNKIQTFRKDMSILPYTASKTEIDSLEGIWLCYTGSPQARSYDAKRYHKIVSNICDVKFKDGYFVFTRYGSNFNHIGYMQFETAGLVSIHSHVRNNIDSIESPKLSLMRLDKEGPIISVISASWNFDVGTRNHIIGIREVYIKQGKGGYIEEVINTPENAGCGCKIIKWHHDNGTVKSFYLKNELLDTVSNVRMRELLDDKSILQREPNESPVPVTDTINISK